jgi:hypothetical protein
MHQVQLDVILQDLRHQAVDAAPNSRQQHQDVGTFVTLDYRALNSCNLSPSLFSPQATIAAPFEGPFRHQPPHFDSVERTEQRKQVLRIKWVVDTDEQGIRRLCMITGLTFPIYARTFNV